jgi:hypothetical protein
MTATPPHDVRQGEPPVLIEGVEQMTSAATGQTPARSTRGANTAGVAVGASTAAKAALTHTALGVTAYSRVLGRKLEQAGGAPVEGGTDPAQDTHADGAKAQQQLKVARWLVRLSPAESPFRRISTHRIAEPKD